MADKNVNEAANPAADMEQSQTPIPTMEQQRRRLLQYFGQEKTQLAMRESILSVTGLTAFDAERIVEQFGNRLNDFLGIDNRLVFREKAVAWTKRIADLTAIVRTMIPVLMETARNVPGCYEYEQVTSLIFLRLPDYPGDVHNIDAVQAWAVERVALEARAVVELGDWIKTHSSAVRNGIWTVLRDCRDLEGCIDDIADELFSQTWRYVADRATGFLDSEVPLHVRLFTLAKRFARNWRFSRLYELKKGTRPKPVRTDDDVKRESQQFYYKEQGKLPPRPVLLGPGDAGAYEPIHPGLTDLAEYDKPLDHAAA